MAGFIKCAQHLSSFLDENGMGVSDADLIFSMSSYTSFLPWLDTLPELDHNPDPVIALLVEHQRQMSAPLPTVAVLPIPDEIVVSIPIRYRKLNSAT